MRNVSLTLCFFTTFSGIALAQTEHELLFAHFGDGESAGGRTVSEFILVNPDKTMEVQATITIKDNDGNPLSGIDLDGQILPKGTLDVTIPACGMRILATDGEGPVTGGSATVTSDKALTGIINFSGSFGAAGVGASVRQSGFVAPMIRNATTNTGFAIMNPGTTGVTVDLQLIDKDGNLLAKATVTIPMMGHLARLLNQISWQPEPGVTLDLSTFEGLIKGTTTGESTTNTGFTLMNPETTDVTVIKGTTTSGQIAATVIQTQPSEFVTMPVGPLPDVTQTGTSCDYSISPLSREHGSGAESGNFSVTAPAADCLWDATSNASWITIESGSGVGDGTVDYSVDANPTNSSRTGTLTVDGQTFTITQAGAQGPPADGNWSGTTEQNKPMSFVVAGGAITEVSYQVSVDGSGCTSEVDATTTFGNPLPIVNNEFGHYSDSLGINGIFTSSTTASGELTFTSSDISGCPGTTITEWSASLQ